MRTSILAFTALTLGLGACTTVVETTTPAAAAPVIEYPHVKRPNLVVSDIERALTIYRDILGLTASDIGTSSPDSYSYPRVQDPGRRADPRRDPCMSLANNASLR